MTRLLLIVVCFLGCGFVSAGYDTRGNFGMNRNFFLRKQQLLLITSIIEQKYCDTGSPSLRIKLRLRYANIGRRSFILYKGSSLIFRYLTSQSTKAAAARDYVQDVRLEIESVEGTNSFNTPNPGEDFIVLKPNRYYDTESDVDVPIEDKANPNPDFLPPGTYFLQVGVSTWSESENLARKLRYRWRRRGILWFHDITSQPMSFTVEEQPKIVDCP